MFYCDSRPLNVRGGRDNNSFEEMHFGCSSFIPEKNLLYAVLSRAYNDLVGVATLEDRKSAAKWFRSKEFTSPGLTYKFIVQALDLPDKFQERIAEIVSPKESEQ